MKKFFVTYTIAFVLLSILLLGILIYSTNVVDHWQIIEPIWRTYGNSIYHPVQLYFLSPPLIVLLSGGIAQLSCSKEYISWFRLRSFVTELGIISGVTVGGIVVGIVSTFYFLKEVRLPVAYWVCLGVSSFLLSLLMVFWKNNYRNLKAYKTEEEPYRPNRRFVCALFNTSLEIAIIWLIIGIISTPFSGFYDWMTLPFLFKFFSYSFYIWILTLLVYIRDKVTIRFIRHLLLAVNIVLVIWITYIGASTVYINAHLEHEYPAIDAYEREDN